MKVALGVLLAFSAINLGAIIPVMIYRMIWHFDSGPPTWLWTWWLIASLPLLPAIALLMILIATGKV